jgi:hypothetical protein
VSLIAATGCHQAHRVEVELLGEGHASVVAVLLASPKADEPITAPKRADSRTPDPFPLQTGLS